MISPNQALTLSEVPVAAGGSAGGVLQTGQRVGSAIGIAAVGAVFFAAVASPGDWAKSFRTALVVTTVFVVAALLLAVVDVLGAVAATGPRPTGPGIAGSTRTDRARKRLLW